LEHKNYFCTRGFWVPSLRYWPILFGEMQPPVLFYSSGIPAYVVEIFIRRNQPGLFIFWRTRFWAQNIGRPVASPIQPEWEGRKKFQVGPNIYHF